MKRKVLFLICVCMIIIAVSGCKSDEEKYYDLIDEASEYGKRESDKAISVLEEAIKIFPDKSKAYIEIYKIYINQEDWESAEMILDEAEEYVETNSEIRKINRYRKKLIAARPWEIITFGRYEQDNNISNGPEPIEWIVLSKTETEMFLLSKYVLDNKPYHYTDIDITWAECSLRYWLNNDFYDEAFSDEEKTRILNKTIKTPDNAKWGTKGGSDTTDHVFLLSIDEASNPDYGFNELDNYRDNINLVCAVTDYAVAHGAELYGSVFNGEELKTKDGDSNICWTWWLRSPGYTQGHVAMVFGSGDVYEDGSSYPSFSDCVRPAVYIKLK